LPAVATLNTTQRIRRLIERGAQRTLVSVGGSPLIVAPDPPPKDPARFKRELGPGRLAVEQESTTTRIYARLSEQDIADIERQILESELREHYEQAGHPHIRRHMILSFGTWLGSPAILEKTGLSRVQPPENVHAMVRGPYASAGGLYEADLITDALAAAGHDPLQIRDALDFGCSSGRVVRSLAAAFPQATWRGCDPNGQAIAWASENLPEIDFFRNGDAPPLPLEDASLDLAYAISIWSHFEPHLGLVWFDEMHRVIRPGGQLVCTTHGPTSVGHYVLLQHRTPQQADEILGALYQRGWWYAPEFGEQGDWGVVNPDWGTAFLSPEWMLTHLCPHWRVLEFAPGRNQENQDVYVLERV
jgi:SAM-dependent methyltransferase